MSFGEAALDQTAPRFLAFLCDHEFTETPSAATAFGFVNASIAPSGPGSPGGRVDRPYASGPALPAGDGTGPWFSDHLIHLIGCVSSALLHAAPWLSAEWLAVAVDR